MIKERYDKRLEVKPLDSLCSSEQLFPSFVCRFGTLSDNHPTNPFIDTFLVDLIQQP
jgi:hypothetical protein